MGNAHLSLFPYDPLATGDGDLVVAAGNDGTCSRSTAPARGTRPGYSATGSFVGQPLKLSVGR
ncbi:hypothetical protein [Nocardioides abyssi]|uniref:Uncharacterized protein n=1 Tax=Nocardioides abyssi TaxID=3058370 RepID=A0ABT8EV12_9ACTN|nr:hypothetical protein [Nocardioides abyssi]MDN4161957.1 hypothetical protein [Nocardioides abyssi]